MESKFDGFKFVYATDEDYEEHGSVSICLRSIYEKTGNCDGLGIVNHVELGFPDWFNQIANNQFISSGEEDIKLWLDNNNVEEVVFDDF